MRKLGPIFAGTDVQEEEMKPLYEHLDGTVEVLGFEHYAIHTDNMQTSEENYVGLQESIEADIVLLEAIQGHQRLTEEQDSGVNSPDYQGLNVDKQKTELSEDTKKFYQEKGLDYRHIATEGVIDKIKEVWEWIVSKLKAWWDRLFNGVKSSSNETDKKKEVCKKLAKEGGEAIKTIEGNDEAIEESFKKANSFAWSKETLGGLILTNDIHSMESLKQSATNTLTMMGKARNFANEFNTIIQNQLKAFLTAFDKGEFSAETTASLQAAFYGKLKASCERHLEKEGSYYYLMLNASVDPLVVANDEQGQLVLDKLKLIDVDRVKAERLEAFEQGSKEIETLRQTIADDWKANLNRKQGAPMFEHLASALESVMIEMTKLEDIMGAIVGTLKILGDKLSTEPPQGKTEDENTHIKALTTAFSQASLLCSGIATGLQNHFHAMRNTAGTLINFLCGIALTNEKSLEDGKAIKDTWGKWSVKKGNASKESFENQLPDDQAVLASLEAEFIEIHREEDPKPSVEEYFNGKRFVTRVSTEGVLSAIGDAIKKVVEWVKKACSRIWNTLTGKGDGGKTPSGFSGKTEALEERLKELDEPLRNVLKGMSKEDWEKLSKELALTKFVKMIYCGFKIDTRVFEHIDDVNRELHNRQDIAGKILNAVHSLGEMSMTLSNTKIGFDATGFGEMEEKLSKVYNEGVVKSLNEIEPVVKRSYIKPLTDRSLASLNSSKVLTISREQGYFERKVVEVTISDNEEYKMREEDFDGFIKEKGLAFYTGLLGDTDTALDAVRDLREMTKDVKLLIGAYRKTLDEFNKLQENIAKLDIDQFTIKDGYEETDSSKAEETAKKLRGALTVVSRSALALGRIVQFIRDDIDGFLTQMDNFIDRLEKVE